MPGPPGAGCQSGMRSCWPHFAIKQSRLENIHWSCVAV
jgi:hypothetical protein